MIIHPLIGSNIPTIRIPNMGWMTIYPIVPRILTWLPIVETRGTTSASYDGHPSTQPFGQESWELQPASYPTFGGAPIFDKVV